MDEAAHPIQQIVALLASTLDEGLPKLVLKGHDLLYDSSAVLERELLAHDPRARRLLRSGSIQYVGDSLTFGEMAQLYHLLSPHADMQIVQGVA